MTGLKIKFICELLEIKGLKIFRFFISKSLKLDKETSK